MKKILIIIGRYLPGFKDGGPIRTIANLVDTFGKKYDFGIMCLDRDRGDSEAYLDIKHGEWNKIGNAKVYYVPKFTNKIIADVAKEFDLLYVCGVFDDYAYKTLFLYKIKKIKKKPIIIASMGVFSSGALSQKHFKKKVYLSICKFFGLFKGVAWSVTSPLEKSDIEIIFGKKTKCIIAEDIPNSSILGIGNRNLLDNTFVFISRITPKKNLMGAIKILSNIKEQVIFDIYGPKEDLNYWNKCEKELIKLPNNISWRYCGVLENNMVPITFQKYNYFLFPTLGENYGHVIFEALSVGCVPIISDRTPWNHLQSQQAGIVLALTNDISNFSIEICKLMKLDYDAKLNMSLNAINIAKQQLDNSIKKSGYLTIFDL